MINPLKRTDAFRCSHEAHQRFGGKVSVYHVIKEKKCYPMGCLYFVWHCVLLEKGSHCRGGFSTPGRKCKGCTYYVEEKMHFQPRLMLAEGERVRLLDDLENYEQWFEKIRSRPQSLAGKIAIVKPWFEKTVDSSGSRLRVRGYLLVFKRGFIGNEPLEDSFYIRISSALMRQYGFVPKMKLEMTGEIKEDRGRIVVLHPKRIEVMHLGWGWHWTDEKAIVAVRTATLMKEQPELCLSCPWGSLADVIDRSEPEEKRYRNLFCLKGIADADACYISGLAKMRKQSVPHEKS